MQCWRKMGYNVLINPKPGLSQASCFSGSFQCPAAAPVAYIFQHYYSYSTQTYDRIYWQQSGPGKVAAGGCPSAPGLGARPPGPALQAPLQLADSDGNRRVAYGSPEHASKPEGVSKTEAGVEVRSARWSPKPKTPPELKSKPKVLVEDER